ncbi:MAG: hypothetical protein H5T49_02890 [Hadesarchaea archaeon]|nr:hypothetical protein [Hadesarchaea archaeon]
MNKDDFEMIEIPGPEEKPTLQVLPELVDWLELHGFRASPNGTKYTKTAELEGRPIKLVVDFQKSEKGTRYAYRLNLDKEPPEWENAPSLRDHPLLLEYKSYRDKLFAAKAQAPQNGTGAPRPEAGKEIEAGPGLIALQKTPEEERAEIMDRMDEKQIITEISGEIRERILEKYFYKFEHQGRTVIGLSYEGVKAIVRRMGHIKTELLRLEERDYGWLAVVKATDLKRNLDAIGAFYQPKFYFPSKQPNPFAATLALVKAQRDAWRHFISERVITETYREWLKTHGKEGD